MGGVIFRYTTDISLFAAFVSAVVLIESHFVAVKKFGSDFGSSAGKLTALLTVLTVLVSSAVALSSEKNISDYSPDAYIKLRDFFVFWS
jgi:hypothetical protein